MRNQPLPTLKVRNQVFHPEVSVAALYPLAFAARKVGKLVGDLNRKLVGDPRFQRFHVLNRIWPARS